MQLSIDGLEALLARSGFTLARTTGSHRHYLDARGRRLTVSYHGRHFDWRDLEAIRRDLQRLEAEERRAPVAAGGAATHRGDAVADGSTPPRALPRPAPRPRREREVAGLHVEPTAVPSDDATPPSAVLAGARHLLAAAGAPSDDAALAAVLQAMRRRVATRPWHFARPLVVLGWSHTRRARATAAERCPGCGAPAPTWIFEGFVAPDPDDPHRRVTDAEVEAYWREHDGAPPLVDVRGLVCARCVAAHALAPWRTLAPGPGGRGEVERLAPGAPVDREWFLAGAPAHPRAVVFFWRTTEDAGADHDEVMFMLKSDRFDDIPAHLHVALGTSEFAAELAEVLADEPPPLPRGKEQRDGA